MANTKNIIVYIAIFERFPESMSIRFTNDKKGFIEAVEHYTKEIDVSEILPPFYQELAEADKNGNSYYVVISVNGWKVHFIEHLVQVGIVYELR